jgi:hypothetical protein
MADKPITRLASEMATKEQKKKRGIFDKVGGFFADAGQEVGRMVTNPLDTAKKMGSMAKQTFYDPIANLPSAFDPTSGLSPLERVNTGLGGGLALADAFTPFMPEGALANALAKRATNKAIAAIDAERIAARLRPGQGYGFHVSHMPNLPTIEDIPGSRNIGGNFGTMYDSTKFTPEGATYAFGIPEGQSGAKRQVEGAVDFAQSARKTAAQNLINPENRNYTMYFTKGNPLEREGAAITTGRLADPEYSTQNSFVDRGQSVFGKQEVLSKYDLDLDALNAPREALMNSPLAESIGRESQLLFNDEMQKVLNHEASFTDNIYKAFSADPAFSDFLSSQAAANKRVALQNAIERQRVRARSLTDPPLDTNQRRA